MQSIERIAIIGATGLLGRPVTRALIEAFDVRVVARNPAQARSLLPPGIAIVTGNLADSSSLERAFAGMDAVYLNLSTSPQQKNGFSPEKDGTPNVVLAARKAGVRRLSCITGLGTRKVAQTNFWVHHYKHAEEQALISSGIPYTIFQPTFFMETLPTLVRGTTLMLIGDPPAPMRWISADDYARQVVAALRSERSANKLYAVQGPQAITMRAAAQRFVDVYDSQIRVRSIPLGVVKGIGLVSPQMRFFGESIEVLMKLADDFQAQATWDDLGAPQTTIEDFARFHKTNSIQGA